MVERFIAYALAFEEAVKSDDWSGVEAFFAENAVYETFSGPPFGGRRVGREAILAFLKQSLDEFDRRFDSRDGELVEGPIEKDGGVWIKYAATYRVADAPEFRIEGEEIAFYDGDRIQRLEDRFANDVSASIAAFMEEHGSKLKP